MEANKAATQITPGAIPLKASISGIVGQLKDRWQGLRTVRIQKEKQSGQYIRPSTHGQREITHHHGSPGCKQASLIAFLAQRIALMLRSIQVNFTHLPGANSHFLVSCEYNHATLL